MTCKATVAGFALAFALAASPSHANEVSLPARAATLVGQYIAAQGNAALQQIRAELREDLARAMRPVLPSRDVVDLGAPAPDRSPAEQR